ncbi:hypothetical protein JCM6882_007361 [Rhodosporidiobolus microsporus]
MEPLSKAIQTTSHFTRQGSPYSPPVYVYRLHLSASWTVGSVAHGGYLLSVLTSTVQQHQSLHAPPHAQHHDPAHLTSQFLSASVPGRAEVEVKVASATKNWTRLDVELWQWTPAADTTDFTNPNSQRVLRISAHFLVTSLPPLPAPGPVSPETLGKAAANVNYLEMPCPLLEHPGSIDMSDGGTPVPPKLRFGEGMRWKDVRTEKRSDGALAWGGWIELKNGEDLRESAALIPFFADVAKNGPEVVPDNEKRGVFWFPTMTLSLDFKSPFPLPSFSSSSAAGPASRTFGLYSTTKTIHDGRHDLTVEVWSAPANLGEGGGEKKGERQLDADGVERWRREGSRLLGVSTQMALCVPIAVNMARGIKNGGKEGAKL